MMNRIALLAILVAVPIWSTGASEQAESPLAQSETLMAQADFYAALLVLEPLLTTHEKSSNQEKALWRANALCDTLVNDYILLRQFVEEQGEPETETRYMEWEKVFKLNELGAQIGFNHLATNYRYGYGFLRRLVELYPDTKWRSAAEYYLIERRFNTGEAVEKWLSELLEYVNRNANSGATEVCMAYLDIAHINDNLWQLLTYHDEYSEYFTTGDSQSDASRAAKCKEEALRYYAKAIVSGYPRRFGYYDRRDVPMTRFQELKQDRKTNRFWILYD